jgi:hypothetical protein
MECVYCKNNFITKTSLNNHQKTAKYCLSLRNIKTEPSYKCEGCGKVFSRSYHLNRHEKNCRSNDRLYQLEKSSEKQVQDCNQYKVQLQDKDNQIRDKDNQIQELKNQIKDLQKQMENIALRAVSYNFEEETIIDIDNTQFTDCSDSESDDDGDGVDKQEYKLTPLEIGQGFIIEHREEDGYINVTNLCKAGGKLFKNWKKTQKTKDFIQVLSRSVLNGTDLLIKTESGGLNENRGTWVHPQVAINIAQWISPQFDVKVSGWVYEIMMTGKVDITNTTSFKQLQQENKNHKIRIQHLTKKYVKAQPRKQYEERNVVYILTTKLMKKDRRYILGKATNLTSRLSVYNKSDEHQVVYYQECGDEETMSMVENMVFYQLNNYREQANRERFLLPEKEEIELFSNIIKKSIEFFNK